MPMVCALVRWVLNTQHAMPDPVALREGIWGYLTANTWCLHFGLQL